jgi:hypothetical protein
MNFEADSPSCSAVAWGAIRPLCAPRLGGDVRATRAAGSIARGRADDARARTPKLRDRGGAREYATTEAPAIRLAKAAITATVLARRFRVVCDGCRYACPPFTADLWSSASHPSPGGACRWPLISGHRRGFRIYSLARLRPRQRCRLALHHPFRADRLMRRSANSPWTRGCWRGVPDDAYCARYRYQPKESVGMLARSWPYIAGY